VNELILLEKQKLVNELIFLKEKKKIVNELICLENEINHFNKDIPFTGPDKKL